MPTITEALQQAAQDLRDAVAAVLGLRSDVQAIKDATQTQATTIINNFINRPPTTVIWWDPVNGDDTKDGSTAAKAKKSLDAILGTPRSDPLDIRQMNNGQLNGRYPNYAPLSITGVQVNNSAAGFQYARRTITFLGTAINSPQDILGNFPSGLEVFGPSVRTVYTDFILPVVPAGYEIRDHFGIRSGANVSLQETTLTVQGAGAGGLIGSTSSRATVFAQPTFGSGAAGHLFLGVAAGANPNSVWNYDSNVTSA